MKCEVRENCNTGTSIEIQETCIIMYLGYLIANSDEVAITYFSC